MPTTTGFRDVDNAVALDIATKFVTKEYLMEFYPDLVPQALTPRLFTWGSNNAGQLGTNNTTSTSSPGETVSRGTNWKQVACGYQYSAGIKTDGTLWTWGRGTDGRLGDNTSSSRSSPVTTAGGGTTWRQVECDGGNFTVAIKTDGTLWAWGFNGSGQLGDNTVVAKSSPVTRLPAGTNWKQVSAGASFSAAIKTDGTLWSCGYNGSGQLGDNTIIGKSSAVTITGGGTTWKQLSCGGSHTAAIKTDGTLWSWGTGTNGALGNSSITNRSSPVTTAGGGTTWKQVNCGSFYTAAIKTDGTLWTWGWNSNGRLGDNTAVSSKISPESIAGGGTNWYKVVAGPNSASAIKTDGTLWVWGTNIQFGQLGDNTTTNRSSPVSIAGGGTNWKQVACGDTHSAAIQESEGW